MKEIKYGVLLDFYGELLTKKQQQALDLYYNEDYSLLEIGEHLNISRQGVFECIKKGAEHLEAYESALHLYEKELHKEAIKAQLLNALSDCTDEVIQTVSSILEQF